MTAAPELGFLAAGGEMGRLIAAHDWTATPLGPVGGWSPALRTAVGIMLESRHPMLVWWGAEFTMLYNDAFMALAGDKHPSALGSRGEESFAEIWPTIGPMLRHVRDSGEATWVDDQLLMMNRRGFLEETYWTYSYSPIRERDGRVAGVFTATNDTTDRVVSARRLDTLRALGEVSAVRATSAEQAATAALEALAGNPVDLPFAFVCLDDGAGLRLAGARGVPDEQLMRAHLADRSRTVPRVHATGEPAVSTGLAARYPGAFPAPLAEPLGARPPDAAVVLPLAAAGDVRRPGVLALGVAPYRPLDPDYRAFLDLVAGQVSGAVADARAHAAQRRRAEALAELDRAKTEFFTGVSHEFRTPLTLIMGPLAEVRAGPAAADPGVRDALDTVHRNALRLRRLVDSVLDFARLQAGRVRGDFRPVDLAARTADLAALFRSAMQDAGLDYRVDCAELGEPVHVDADMWDKVVLNLLSNALKFTLRGRVELTLHPVGRDAVLRVADTGVRIPPADLPHVFERFHRAQRTAARSHEGAGIGLALVRELVELHGGRVEVTSEPGAGSVFTVRVPLGVDHLPAAGPDAVVPGAGDGAGAAFVAEARRWLPVHGTDRADGAGPAGTGDAERAGRVLVADDNADMRAYLRRLLAGRWRVDTVADGVAALAAVREWHPDLVVSDVMMPGLDGLALVSALRADPRTAHVPVLLVSARAGPGAPVRGLAAGADDYLVKPFEPDELVARVAAHLRLGRARRVLPGAGSVAAPGMTWVSDRAGGLVHVNRAWREFAGGGDEVPGSGWRTLVHPDDAAAHAARTAAARAAGLGWESEYRMRRADGEYRWLLEHAVPVGGDPEAVTGWVGSCVDVTDRRRAAERALHAERERYRTLVEQAPVGIWTADAAGTLTFLNDRIVELCGRTAEEIRRTGWAVQLHPDDVEPIRREWTAAVDAGTGWEGEYRLLDPAGGVRHLISSARPLHDEHGAVTGFLGTTVDVTDQRQAELARRETAAVQAAREVSEAAAARLRAMVGGLAAIVWEADWDPDARLPRFTFVSERAEELLGHPAERWLADPAFWPGLVHAGDRAAVLAATAEHLAAGRDHDLRYRAVAADGRTVWLHQVVHVVAAAGRPLRAQGLTVDVTVQARAERATALLAESGRLLGGPGSPEQKLESLARSLMGELGDAAIVSVLGPDRLLRRIAVAHPDPAAERLWLGLAPSRIPPQLTGVLAAGRPVVLPVTEELLGGAARDDTDHAARRALDARTLLLVPLAGADGLLGVLGLASFGRERAYDEADLELAAELGRRAAIMVEADRRQTRERHLQAVVADLASAGSVAEAAQRLAARLTTVLGASAMSVYQRDPDRGLQLVHSVGYRAEVLEEFATIRLDADLPLAAAARNREPVWLRERGDWLREFPHLVQYVAAAGRNAAAALPLTASGRLVGVIGVSFGTEREFPRDEREFVRALTLQAAPAFERAATADRRRMIAETLQDSLLPPELPRLERVDLAAQYLPGARGAATGGDWYDVIPLDGDRVAVAVGDVVGHGIRAAAVMGQLRSALSGYLLEGHGPVRALEHLDRFAGRVPGAVGSTVGCLILDVRTGDLEWARAGHPPPLVVDGEGARFLEDGGGTVLGVRGRPPYAAGHARIAPGASVVLYTDGLVEVRAEVVDAGLARLAAAGHRHHALAPGALAAALLADALPGAPTDDVALIVARLLPAPLALTLPGEPTLLRTLRTRVQRWAALCAVPEDTLYDLQLALGEAAANVVEHAYGAGPPGRLRVELERAPDGGLRVAVRDEGSWRPAPADKGYRGRGLQLIDALATDVTVQRTATGTTVSFTLPPAAADVPAAPAAARPAGWDGTRPTSLLRSGPPDGARIAVLGDLDIAGVRAVRAELLAGLRGVVTLDLTGTAYLASAGVLLITEMERAARAAGGALRILVRAGGVVRRVLALSGLDQVVVVDTGAGCDAVPGGPAAATAVPAD